MPVERILNPLNGVERAISVLSTSSALRSTGMVAQEFAGAEWWVQDVGPEENPKGFHTDCNFQTKTGNARNENVYQGNACRCAVFHPTVASVLYLVNNGGATAIFGQAKQFFSDYSILQPRLPTEVCIVNPKRNRVLVFEGDRYHAVLHPASSYEDSSCQRVLSSLALP